MAMLVLELEVEEIEQAIREYCARKYHIDPNNFGITWGRPSYTVRYDDRMYFADGHTESVKR